MFARIYVIEGHVAVVRRPSLMISLAAAAGLSCKRLYLAARNLHHAIFHAINPKVAAIHQSHTTATRKRKIVRSVHS
jgi:hypothetical protein